MEIFTRKILAKHICSLINIGSTTLEDIVSFTGLDAATLRKAYNHETMSVRTQARLCAFIDALRSGRILIRCGDVDENKLPRVSKKRKAILDEIGIKTTEADDEAMKSIVDQWFREQKEKIPPSSRKVWWRAWRLYKKCRDYELNIPPFPSYENVDQIRRLSMVYEYQLKRKMVATYDKRMVVASMRRGLYDRWSIEKWWYETILAGGGKA